ncbi:YncE family protein [Nonomuraea sp. bgisy101]|uniref:YncE family protein n=1 Tax=Nonomuraea sp. bgisy101 TaxID=3413784 RepID=UPI003D70BF0F
MAGLAVSQATTATAADSLTPLDNATGSFDIAGDIAVGGGKVFTSMDDRIIVADTEGRLTGAITGLSDVRDLVTTPDGTRLYAALGGSHEVAEINTADLGIIRRIPLAPYQCPSRLALAEHQLWVSYGCPADSSGGAVGVDLSASIPDPVPTNPLVDAPKIASAGGTLVVADFWDLRVYDIQNGTPTLRGTINSYDHQLWNGWGQVTLAPDGLTAYTTPGSANDFDAWDLTTLTKARSYGKRGSSPPPSPASSPGLTAPLPACRRSRFPAAPGAKTISRRCPTPPRTPTAPSPSPTSPGSRPRGPTRSTTTTLQTVEAAAPPKRWKSPGDARRHLG